MLFKKEQKNYLAKVKIKFKALFTDAFCIKFLFLFLNKNFFYQPDEIVFRSFSQLIHKVGNKKNYPRGNKVINLLSNFKSSSCPPAIPV